MEIILADVMITPYQAETIGLGYLKLLHHFRISAFGLITYFKSSQKERSPHYRKVYLPMKDADYLKGAVIN